MKPSNSQKPEIRVGQGPAPLRESKVKPKNSWLGRGPTSADPPRGGPKRERNRETHTAHMTTTDKSVTCLQDRKGLGSHGHPPAAVESTSSSLMSHPVATKASLSSGTQLRAAGSFGERISFLENLFPHTASPVAKLQLERKTQPQNETTAHCKPSGQASPQVRMNPPDPRVTRMCARSPRRENKNTPPEMPPRRE